MRNGRNLTKHELIGLPVQVVRCPDPSFSGAEGTVVDESRNMLVLRRPSDGRERRVAKEGCTFRFGLPGGASVEVEGGGIRFRPEDRVKRCR
jgi:ribonuclease P protein subunit POP4